MLKENSRGLRLGIRRRGIEWANVGYWIPLESDPDLGISARIQKFIRFGEEGCSGTGRKIVGGVLL